MSTCARRMLLMPTLKAWARISKAWPERAEEGASISMRERARRGTRWSRRCRPREREDQRIAGRAKSKKPGIFHDVSYSGADRAPEEEGSATEVPGGVTRRGDSPTGKGQSGAVIGLPSVVGLARWAGPGGYGWNSRARQSSFEREFTRLTGGRLSCTVVFEREFSIEEIARFRAVGPEQRSRACRAFSSRDVRSGTNARRRRKRSGGWPWRSIW